MTFIKTKGFFSAVVLWIGMALCASWARGARLYLLSGTALFGNNLPVRLYSADVELPGSLRMVQEVAPGLSCVLTDYARGLVVVASPAVLPTDYVFIRMDNPEGTRTSVHFAGPEKQAGDGSRGLVVGGIFLLALPDHAPGVAMTYDSVTLDAKVRYASSLTFLKPGSDKPVLMPFGNLTYAQFDGFVGGGLTMSQSEMALRGDPLHVVIPGTNDTSIGIPRPSYLKERPEGEMYLLVSNDDKRAVMEPLQPAEPGVIDVFDKGTGEWRRAPIPFGSARIRAFGQWLAMIEMRSSQVTGPGGPLVRRSELKVAHVSPGREKRQSEQIGPPYRMEPGLTVDDVFENLQIGGRYFPGELLLYNLDTGIQMRISTGIGDSEIVLVTDSAVYYRVDDVLYLRHISGSTLSEPVRLASGSEVVQVHWAFLN